MGHRARFVTCRSDRDVAWRVGVKDIAEASVIPFAANDRIGSVAIGELEGVVAIATATVKGVSSDPGRHFVVALAAKHSVIARARHDSIVACTSIDGVITRT